MGHYEFIPQYYLSITYVPFVKARAKAVRVNVLTFSNTILEVPLIKSCTPTLDLYKIM